MKSRFAFDWWLLMPVLLLVSISLTTLFSIDFQYFKSQLLSFFIAILAFFAFSKLDPHFFKEVTKPLYLICVGLLILGFLIGIESRGSVRWVDIFGIRLQLSEILKPFFAVCLSGFLARFSHPRKKEFMSLFFFLLPVALLIALQPDLGSALVYVGVVLIVLISIGFPIQWFLVASLPIILSLPFLWTRLHDYQQQRILTFLNPTADPLNTSYNTMQAIIAIGSGSFLGKGWFNGTQSSLHFLPERHTDFIFATIAEGMGFVGSLFLIVLFAFLCYRIYGIFQKAEDTFTKAFSACCFSVFFIQGFVNIAMNVGLLPIVGITLPFVSFGGSSLLSNFIFLGILSALSASQREKEVLRLR